MYYVSISNLRLKVGRVDRTDSNKSIVLKPFIIKWYINYFVSNYQMILLTQISNTICAIVIQCKYSITWYALSNLSDTSTASSYNIISSGHSTAYYLTNHYKYFWSNIQKLLPAIFDVIVNITGNVINCRYSIDKLGIL